MVVVWVFTLMVVSIIAQEVYEPQAEVDKNTTTLYPVNKYSKNYFNVTKSNNNEKEDKSSNRIKEAATAWSIDAQLAQHDADVQKDNETESKEPAVIEKPNKQFKPSPHLETYFETDVGHYYQTLKKPPVGFKFVKDFSGYPYPEVHTKNGWKIAPPITVSAGDLYKLPESFRETDGTDQGSQGEFKNHRPNGGVKKMLNPWKGLFRLVTAFLPVGLIISALTPSVVSIQSPGSRSPIRNLHRRSDVAETRTSDQCRRKLLCLLRNIDVNTRKNTKVKKLKKPCSEWQCEDEAVIAEVLPRLLQQWSGT